MITSFSLLNAWFDVINFSHLFSFSSYRVFYKNYVQRKYCELRLKRKTSRITGENLFFDQGNHFHSAVPRGKLKNRRKQLTLASSRRILIEC